MRLFEKFYNKPLLEVNKADIRAYVEDCRKKGLVTKTINLRLTALSSFFEFAVFEDLIQANPVNATRKRYLMTYKTDGENHQKKLISVDEAARLVSFAVDIRDKAIIVMLLKTGVRKHELIDLDISDINWNDQSILLKSTKKRTNRKVYFDDEAAYILKRWLKAREMRANRGTEALFLSSYGNRISHCALDKAIHKTAGLAGLHDAGSKKPEDHFTPHCCRHWNTTHLLRAGMKREFVQWLRGDATREAVDIYYHIDPEDVRQSYLAHIPQLGV